MLIFPWATLKETLRYLLQPDIMGPVVGVTSMFAAALIAKLVVNLRRRRLNGQADPDEEDDQDVNFERVRALKIALREQRTHYLAVIKMHEEANDFLKKQLREARGEAEPKN